MSVKIYNSLTKQKEDFVPLEGRKVRMYSCGVTVYDKCHIGHARSLYIFDVIRKHLIKRGYDVKFIRNITDVDDKIIKKANDSGRTFDDVIKENICLYEADLKNLGVSHADLEPRATENIEEMVAYIEKLIEKGYAYESDGDVYFSVKKFKDYGKLSGQSIDKMLEGVRIQPGEKKKDSLDFVLWKKSKEGEPSWPSPWGEGRPGWHIECSCMSMKFLEVESLDIHAGGRDLIFPHHENEVAQSEALTGKPFAKYWIHHGLLKINGQKMAKSLGNFITLDEILSKFSANVLKLFFLQSHYASEIDFSWEKMEEVAKTYDRIQNVKMNLLTLSADDLPSYLNPEDPIAKFYYSFMAKLDNDFNTPQALSVLFEFVKFINAKQQDDGFAGDELERTAYIFNEMVDSFGLVLAKEKEVSLSDDEKDLLEQRKLARASKDFSKSDEIRDQLKLMGIVVKDGKDGQEWSRI